MELSVDCAHSVTITALELDESKSPETQSPVPSSVAQDPVKCDPVPSAPLQVVPADLIDLSQEDCVTDGVPIGQDSVTEGVPSTQSTELRPLLQGVPRREELALCTFPAVFPLDAQKICHTLPHDQLHILRCRFESADASELGWTKEVRQNSQDLRHLLLGYHEDGSQ